MITANNLKDTIEYNSDTGMFTWRVAIGSVSSGSLAGNINSKSGYVLIKIHGRLYRAHRLAWLYMNGKWPNDQIDHVNGDRADNRWSNLRGAIEAQNSANRKRRRDSRSGTKGVSWNIYKLRWHARITVKGCRIHLGYFDALNDAHLAYATAANKHFKEFARIS